MTHARRALLSVTDKTGVLEFAVGLRELGFEILSTGGTARVLTEGGVEVVEVAEFTGAHEILGGRVKTLHPRVHGGILARTDLDSDLADLAEADIPPIDVVAVNLYRFEEARDQFQRAWESGSKASLTDPAVAAVIEKIDIGGPTLLRAAAKNAKRVWVVIRPSDYPAVLAGLASDAGQDELRARLAAVAFRRVAEYDVAIDEFFGRYLGEPSGDGGASMASLLSGDLPTPLEAVFESGADAFPQGKVLRYGENPHQKAFYLRGRDPMEAGVLHAEQLSGKELSYNNLLDADSALGLVKEFTAPAAVVVKHNNPCGTAVAETPLQAFQNAYEGDPLSAFGGIVALNRTLTAPLAEVMATRDHFFEVVVAPAIDADAVRLFREGPAWGKNVRLLACGDVAQAAEGSPRWAVRSIVGGVLVQERDVGSTPAYVVATGRSPTAEEMRDLEIAWKIVGHVRSNAIVVVRDGALVGTGAGQMSRVDSVEIACRKAGERARGAALGSDAFFPFRDGIDAAALSGIACVIQPGGSRRDKEVIEACEEHAMTMVMTEVRRFRH